jgi:tRNA(Ser,Leu) C12 N-acetylase TAN1
MKQTAVEWMVNQLYTKIEMRGDGNLFDEILKQAKEIEKEQSHKYAEFAIRCDRMDMKILNFDGYIKLETFKNE